MRTIFIGALCTVAMIAGVTKAAHSQDALKVAVPQRGSWDAGLPELGKRGNIFKKHGLDLEILYTQAGPESIQALIAGSGRHRDRKRRAGRLRNVRQRSPHPHHQ